jgi:signal transduction histidine kinase
VADPSTNQTRTEAGLLRELDDLSARMELLDHAVSRSQRMATLGMLAAGVAHEMNNILTPPANYARLALRDPENHELVQQALERIIQSCDRAGRVVESILGYSREGDAEKDCLVSEAVAVVIECAKMHPAWRGAQVELDVDPMLRVAMPSTELEQVLLNLVLNALHAMGDDRGRIRISAQCSTWNNLPGGGSGVNGADGSEECSTWNNCSGDEPSADGPCGILVVEDSGGGVPAEMRERIFEPFVSAGDSESPHQGTGLGLAISQRLVEQAGGRIEVGESDLGGAMFVVGVRTAV